MIRIAYLSIAAKNTSAGKVKIMSQKAHTHNRKHGISGVLVFNGTHFGQVLEGDEKPVYQLVQRILNDQRHYDFILNVAVPIEQRYFHSWGMRLISSEEFDGVKMALGIDFKPSRLISRNCPTYVKRIKTKHSEMDDLDFFSRTPLAVYEYFKRALQA